MLTEYDIDTLGDLSLVQPTSMPQASNLGELATRETVTPRLDSASPIDIPPVKPSTSASVGSWPSRGISQPARIEDEEAPAWPPPGAWTSPTKVYILPLRVMTAPSVIVRFSTRSPTLT